MQTKLWLGTALAALITTTGANAANPFETASNLPLQAPRFDLIKDADYQPAFEEAMALHAKEVQAIADNSAAPTFDNTIGALEKSGRMLERVSLAFFAVVQANTNDTLDKVQADVTPKLSAHNDDILLNPKLFARVKALHDNKGLQLVGEQRQVLDLYYNQFAHNGALLSAGDQTRLRAINTELASLQTDFQQKLVAATKAGALVVDDKARLAGLDEAALAAAAAAGKERKLDGKYVIPLQNTTQQPQLSALSNRATRQALFDKSWTRAEQGDANDTRATLVRIAQLRADQAKLFGYPTFADYALYDQMAKTPATAQGFLKGLVPALAAEQAREVADINAEIKADGQSFDVKPWDWDRYADRVKAKRYALDEEKLKPYFEITTVLEKGVFYAATELYGITFKRRTDLPVYHPDVTTYTVYDKDGSVLGIMYFDYWKRDNKSGGAWMSNFVNQSKLLGTKPVIYNVANFSKPAAGQPALITSDDVTHHVPRIRPRAPRPVRQPDLSAGVGHQHRARFRRVPLAVQRALGARSQGARQLCQGLSHRRGHRARTRSPRSRTRTSSTRAIRSAKRSPAAMLDMAWHSRAAGAAKPDVDEFEASDAQRTWPRHRPRAAALSHQLFRAHLGRWLCGRLLRLSVDQHAPGRRLQLVRTAWRHDPRQRPALPRPGAEPGPYPGLCGHVPQLLRQGPRRGADAGRARADGAADAIACRIELGRAFRF